MTLDELERALAEAPHPEFPNAKLAWDLLETTLGTDEAKAFWTGNRNPPSSLDAAVALCERVLPGFLVHVWQDHRGNCALVNKPSPISRSVVEKITKGAPTLALALFLAVVRALKAQKETP